MTKKIETKSGDYVKFNQNVIEGYLIRYTDSSHPDLQNDYFTSETNFGDIKEVPLFYNHGHDVFIDKMQIGMGQLEYRDDGVYIKAELNIKNPQKFKKEQLRKRQEYLDMISELAQEDSILGWSSGSAAHLVVREKAELSDATEIKQWIIAEASLTPTPAEPKNIAYIKSIYNKYKLVEDVMSENQELKRGAKLSKSRLEKIKQAYSLLNDLITEVDIGDDDDDDDGKSVVLDEIKKSQKELKELHEFKDAVNRRLEAIEERLEPFNPKKVLEKLNKH